MKALTKLGLAAAALFAGFKGMTLWRKAHSFTPLVAGHGYTVVLGYSGQGVGGPLSSLEVQQALDQGAAGFGTLAVASTSTDPAKKTITYLIGVLRNINGTSDVLAPTSFPSAFGKLSVEVVQDTGSIPVTPAAVA